MEWLKDFLEPELIWFAVGLLLMLAEFIVPGLVIAFFAIGAWVVAAICLLRPLSLNAQLGIFVGSSVLSLLVARRWVKGMFDGFTTSKQDANVDLNDFVGQRAVVTTAIAPKQPGKVEFHGTHWSAEATQDIAAGSVVEITQKDNLTLKVKPA